MTISILIGTTVFAQTGLSPTDKQQIIENLESLVQAINTGDIQKITSSISPNYQTLQTNIQERVRGEIWDGISYQLDYSPFDRNVELINTDTVRVKGKYAASGVGWNVSGLSTYFVFERQNNQWFITDTDFHKKIGGRYVVGMIVKIFAIVVPIILIFGAFWLWMLIDCVKREFDDKLKWVILILVLSIFGAIFYFFKVRRKLKQQEKMR